MVEFNYAKIETNDGELIGYIAMEVGTDNEVAVLDYVADNGYILVKSTKEEYDNADDDFDEIIIRE
jgi:hypothetical protein